LVGRRQNNTILLIIIIIIIDIDPKRVEVKGQLRRLHTKELYDPYSSPNIIGRSNQEE
jgi:hypothetical protein